MLYLSSHYQIHIFIFSLLERIFPCNFKRTLFSCKYLQYSPFHCTWLTFQSTLGYGDVTSLTDLWIAFLSTPDLLDLPFIRFFPLALDFPLLWDPLLEPFPFSFLTRLPFLSNSWQSYFSWEIQKENSPHTIFLSLIRALFLLFFCDSSPLVFFWFSVCSSFAFLFWVAGEAAMKVIISISF